ncbi:MAG TPA: hypothetical protein VD906_16660, partial [Caulobacteraceae bacterium]|nr:hypothetical protein [Caulobacteraceae bacterium]
ERKTGVSVRNVLAQGRGVTSTALWVSFFFINFVIYVLMQWLPSFVTAGGGGAVQSGAAVAWFKMGGILGSFICAAYIDRRGNPYPILTAFLLLAAVMFVFLSSLPAVAVLFVIVVAVTGVLLSGPMYATNGLMGRLLPTYVRTGGLALTAGVGRMGAMTGPFTVGLMLQAGWTEQDLLMAAIAPTLLSAAIITGLGLRHRAIARQAVAAA